MLKISREHRRVVLRWRGFLVATVFATYGLAWGQPSSNCKLPSSLLGQIGELHRGYSVITENALRKNDRSRFRSDHGMSCPGFVKINFYGNELPTYGLALAKRDGKNVQAKLLVATQAEKATNKWNMVEIDSASSTAIPVIWTEAPGEYKDVHGEKAIRAKHSVLLFVEYESWAIAYAWNGTKVEKVWLSD